MGSLTRFERVWQPKETRSLPLSIPTVLPIELGGDIDSDPPNTWFKDLDIS